MPVLFRIKQKDIPKSYNDKMEDQKNLIKELKYKALLENDPYHIFFHSEFDTRYTTKFID